MDQAIAGALEQSADDADAAVAEVVEIVHVPRAPAPLQSARYAASGGQAWC
jgi:hypothetical protein